MDPVTHGLTGALVGKAFFTGRQSSAPGAAERARLAVYAATLGSVFPDIDVLLGPITRSDLATIELHRGFTHSFSGIPVFAMLLAMLTRGYVRRRGLEGPSWGLLTVIYGLGISSHVLLDVITSFGTMIGSPWNHTRVAWDLVSIVDFAMTAIVLLPHVLARIYRVREGSSFRAARAWVILTLCGVAAAGLVGAAGFPTSVWAVTAASMIFAVLCFLPARGNWGIRVHPSTWARAGLLVLLAYLGLCAAAHRAALRRVEQFAAGHGLRVERVGALPLPPSAAHWDGLIRTPDGVYEMRLSLGSGNPGTEPLVYRFFPDAPPNQYIEAAQRLPKAQVYLWFARFPVFRFEDRGDRKVLAISDLRFFGRAGRPGPFTFRVTFDAAGHVIQQTLARAP